MTKPEETTAALIARLHQDLNAARDAADHNAKCADEQRARAEKAEEIAEVHAARCEGFERELAKAHKKSETLADMLVERTRERDEARAKYNAEVVAVRREFNEAREQLAKLEWSAFRRPDCGGPLSVCCPSCQGVKRGHEVGSAFKRDEVGHRPTCWFAKKKAAKEAGSNDKAERYPFPKRAGIGEVTVTVGEPARPEPRFKVGERVVNQEGGEIIIEQISHGSAAYEHAYRPVGFPLWIPESDFRPAPKYNVGGKANYEGKEVTITDRIDGANSGWYYRVKEHHWSIPECDLKPAPKFAVGEWVTHGDKAGEIIERYAAEGSWIYKLSDAPAIGHWEQTIIAQTPQHKHGCKGSIFLGRHEGFDLWWRPTMREVVAVDPAVAYYYSVDGELLSRNPLAIEARRRAVARGLVKP